MDDMRRACAIVVLAALLCILVPTDSEGNRKFADINNNNYNYKEEEEISWNLQDLDEDTVWNFFDSLFWIWFSCNCFLHILLWMEILMADFCKMQLMFSGISYLWLVNFDNFLYQIEKRFGVELIYLVLGSVWDKLYKHN